MKNSNPTFSADRRRADRVNADIRLNYQVISRAEALNDPYSSSFAVPQFFLMKANMEELDQKYQRIANTVSSTNPELIELLEVVNQKITLTHDSFYEAIVKALLPKPIRVNISESGMSFFTGQALPSGTHLHVSISHPEMDINISTTMRIVYCEEKPQEGFKIGAYFVSLHPADHAVIVELVEQIKMQETLKAQAES